ncbi:MULTISPECIES: hypothetical protein [Deefgea]|uniref:hypothetical protein n=1 Tax=Deefgea TaxID=400947 RepID=UPI003570C289
MDDRARILTKNAHQLLALELCDVGIVSTHWQKSPFPAAYHDKIQVIYEGVDTDLAKPDPDACFTLPNGRMLLMASDQLVDQNLGLSMWSERIQSRDLLVLRMSKIEILLVAATALKRLLLYEWAMCYVHNVV